MQQTCQGGLDTDTHGGTQMRSERDERTCCTERTLRSPCDMCMPLCVCECCLCRGVMLWVRTELRIVCGAEARDRP